MLTPNHSPETHGSPETVSSITIHKKWGVKSSLAGHEFYILKTNLDLPCRRTEKHEDNKKIRQPEVNQCIAIPQKTEIISLADANKHKPLSKDART